MSALFGRMEEALAGAVGAPVSVLRSEPLSGGCINHAARLHTSRGVFFAKWNDARRPGLFTQEAASLEALRGSGTSLVIPAPVAARDPDGTGPGFLTPPDRAPGPRGARSDAPLGEGLAELHRASWIAFGFTLDTYCGTTLQPNQPLPTWLEFYRDRRLGPQLAMAAAKGLLAPRDRALGERLLERLEAHLAGTEEPPALIHGDLWSGNLHVAPGGRPALIDPAAYYGHREAELGMMTLFGGFSERVFAAYEAAAPLPAGWEERGELYQLYHVLNHANLFGGGYVEQARGIMRRWA